MRKIAMNRIFYFSAIIELVRELVTSKMQKKIHKDTYKNVNADVELKLQ